MTTDIKTKRPTSFDVARLAGVSQITVSRAFTGKAAVAGKTQRRIIEAAQRLGYRPNALARGLRGGRTQTIAMLWPMAGPQHSEGLVRSLAQRMVRHGYVVHPIETLNDPVITEKELDHQLHRGVDAVVIKGTDTLLANPEVLHRLQAFGAAVLVHHLPVENCPVDLIVHDRLAACRQVADHFVTTGRRRLAMLGPAQSAQAKAHAFTQRAQQLGCPVKPKNLIAYKDDLPASQLIEAYRQGLHEACGDEVPFDALFCSTDEGAASAMMWLRQRGKRVPEDVAVIGFNNSLWGKCFDPPIASIERHIDLLVKAVEKMIVARLEDNQLPAQQLVLPMTFVDRDSAGMALHR